MSVDSKLHPFEDPLRRCLKVHEWPEADQILWEAAMQPGDILDGTVGAGFHWCAQTREKYRKGYGRWLTFLIAHESFDPTLSPGDRITNDSLKAYIQELSQTVSSWTLWGRLAELLAALRAMEPDRDWSHLRKTVRYFENRVVDSRNKLQRLRSPDEIITWAYGYMDELRDRLDTRHALSWYRDALMIGLLVQCPMRLGNLTMIQIEKHLTKHSDGYQLVFAPYETKTRKPLSLPVPDSLTAYLEYYMAAVRPLLLQSNNDDHLWITRYGDPLRNKAAHLAITTATKRAFGVSINPHLFRDCAVTFVAVNDPKHIGIAAPILGHTDPRTTEKHYIQANQIEAGRRLRNSVDTLREELAPRPRKREGGRT